LTPEQSREIDKTLAPWRQGDTVLGSDVPFIHLANLDAPTTSHAEDLAHDSGGDNLAIVSVDVLGLVVLTQTCDLVRTSMDRPFVEVCPLVELPDHEVQLVRLGRRPRFASLPALGNEKWVADLDRVMTVEKGLLASLTDRRRSGVTSEADIQTFTEALGRKRTRAALPDDFTAAVGPMRSRILDKHDRDSPEGRFLRSIKEIRVRSIPHWMAEEIEVEFLFVFQNASGIPTDADKYIIELVGRVAKNGRIVEVYGRPVGLDQLSAASYLDGERLDLDHLSQSA